VNDNRGHEVCRRRMAVTQSENGEAEQIASWPTDWFKIGFGGLQAKVVVDADGGRGGEAKLGMNDTLQEDDGSRFRGFDEDKPRIRFKGGQSFRELHNGVIAVLHLSKAPGMEKCHGRPW
jgi:hypothetical protein